MSPASKGILMSFSPSMLSVRVPRSTILKCIVFPVVVPEPASGTRLAPKLIGGIVADFPGSREFSR